MKKNKNLNIPDLTDPNLSEAAAPVKGPAETERIPDEVLFQQLAKRKKRKRLRNWLIVLGILLVVGIALHIAVSRLRARVLEEFASQVPEVQSFEVTRDTLEATIAGSGVLSQVDLEEITAPAGVEILKVNFQEDQEINKGQALAEVSINSVLGALAAKQQELSALDEQIASAKEDEVDRYMTAAVPGRVKIIYAQEEMDIAACMIEHGALAVLSLDGSMSVMIEAGALKPSDKVMVGHGSGEEEKLYEGTVSRLQGAFAEILVSDEVLEDGESVMIYQMPEEGQTKGKALSEGTVTIHNPLKITGFAGTIERIYVQPGDKVSAGSDLFRLTDTGYRTNYDTLLRTRETLEEDLMELLQIYQDGAILSPMDGVISSVAFDAEQANASANSQSEALSVANMTDMASAMQSYAGTYGASATGLAPAPQSRTALVTIDPAKEFSITIPVEETNILSLKEGQEADISIPSIGEDAVFKGVVSEVIKIASGESEMNAGTSLMSSFMSGGSSGVTTYSATILVPREGEMLSGMSADVDIHIQGVENALIVPVDAVHQTSSRYYVYTAYNEETGEYEGEKEVRPGLSNSQYIEILSGLSEGETVYYIEEEEFDFFSQFYGRNGRGQ
ncbi:MAG: hypothetical protein J6P72_09935 [Firmicutes bacterium]|nr:hypothetical protein [Bacillota bacterium]